MCRLLALAGVMLLALWLTGGTSVWAAGAAPCASGQQGAPLTGAPGLAWQMRDAGFQGTLTVAAELADGALGLPGEAVTWVITLTNTGAAHYLPTGTPDRHLTATIRLVDRSGAVLREDDHVMKRSIMWRPFIVDLRDTRLPRWQPRVFQFDVDLRRDPTAVAVEAQVRYHLLDESRRRRIGYENKEPIAYDVFRARIALDREKTN